MKTKTSTHKTGPEDAKCRCGIRRPMYYTCGSCGITMNARYFEKLRVEEKAAARERLIAAAPDLLLVCKKLGAWNYDPNGDGFGLEAICAEAHAAIAKAEGR